MPNGYGIPSLQTYMIVASQTRYGGPETACNSWSLWSGTEQVCLGRAGSADALAFLVC